MTTNIMRLLDGIIEPLLAPLDALPAGAHVVQLACGTGGLSLALHRRRPDLRITAIDIDPAALDAGRAAGSTVSFERMSMAELTFDDASVDAIISRMGLGLPGTAPFDVAVREAARVLRPGAPLSIATWADLAGSPYTRLGMPVLRRVLPAGAVPAVEAPFAAEAAGFEEHFAAAGFAEMDAEWLRWETEYPSFDDWWGFVAGFGPLRPLFDRAGPEARRVMAEQITDFRTASGGYRFPAVARRIVARR